MEPRGVKWDISNHRAHDAVSHDGLHSVIHDGLGSMTWEARMVLTSTALVLPMTKLGLRISMADWSRASNSWV
jgi:hypothetical protein